MTNHNCRHILNQKSFSDTWKIRGAWHITDFGLDICSSILRSLITKDATENGIYRMSVSV